MIYNYYPIDGMSMPFQDCLQCILFPSESRSWRHKAFTLPTYLAPAKGEVGTATLTSASLLSHSSSRVVEVLDSSRKFLGASISEKNDKTDNVGDSETISQKTVRKSTSAIHTTGSKVLVIVDVFFKVAKPLIVSLTTFHKWTGLGVKLHYTSYSCASSVSAISFTHLSLVRRSAFYVFRNYS